MTRQIRMALLTAIIILGVNSEINAQEKYEYAIITYVTNPQQALSVSYDNREFEKIEIVKEARNWTDYSPALKQLAKMTSEGWEIINTSTIGGSAIALNGQLFYLRKKR